MDSRSRSLGDVRACVVERLRSRREELEEAIFARFRDGLLDTTSRNDAEYITGLRTAIAAAVDYGLQGIEEGEDWSGSIPAEVVAQAQRAARLGVSLDTVLRRYVAGHTVLGDFVMQEADRSASSERTSALRQALRAQASLLDRLTAAIAREYRREVERAGRSPERRRADRVRKMLAGAVPDTRELGYNLDCWHLGLIATGARAGETVRGLVAGLDHQALSVSHGDGAVWAWLGGRRKLTAADIAPVLSGKGPPGVVLALGEPAAGIDGWRLTHRQAQAALLVALRRPQRLTRYADVALLASTLRDDMLARSLIEIFLSPLNSQRDGGAVVRETLRAYFAAGLNASSAAAALGVARHTIENRLCTVEQALGCPLTACLAELQVALRVEGLGGVGAE